MEDSEHCYQRSLSRRQADISQELQQLVGAIRNATRLHEDDDKLTTDLRSGIVASYHTSHPCSNLVFPQRAFLDCSRRWSTNLLLTVA